MTVYWRKLSWIRNSTSFKWYTKSTSVIFYFMFLLQLWDLNTGEALCTFMFDVAIHSVTMDVSEFRLYAGGSSGHIFCVNLFESVSHSLTLSLPIFWQICFLSATFVLVVRGIMPYEAFTFFKILISQFILLKTFYEYPKSDLSKLKTPWTQQIVCKWETFCVACEA